MRPRSHHSLASVFALALGAALHPLAAQAATPAGVVLRHGVEVRVELTHEARRGLSPIVRHGEVAAARGDSLTLVLIRPTTRRELAWTDVVWMDTLVGELPRYRRALTGATIGAVAVPILMLFPYALCEGNCPSATQYFAITISSGALTGAALSQFFERGKRWQRVVPVARTGPGDR